MSPSKHKKLNSNINTFLSTSDNKIEVSDAFVKGSSGSINSKNQSEDETATPYSSLYEQTSIGHMSDTNTSNSTSIEFPHLDDLNKINLLKVSNDPQQSLTISSEEIQDNTTDSIIKATSSPSENDKMKSTIKLKHKNVRASTVMEF